MPSCVEDKRMGVLKWLKREKITLISRRTLSPEANVSQTQDAGTIRTEKYKQDLAEFQARRSAARELPDTPKQCGRHSMPTSCTQCTDNDTFNYEKRSASKYKKSQRARSVSEDVYEPVPNVQFLFQNQVFMPGNIVANATYSEPYKPRASRQRHRSKTPEYSSQKHLDFKQPMFYKNNALKVDVRDFLESKCDDVDGYDEGNRSSSDSVQSDKMVEVMSELKNLDNWADEQLKQQDTSNCNNIKTETNSVGLPVVTSSDIDVNVDRNKVWNSGKWGVVPIQTKKVTGAKYEQINRNTEINILRKCRHPNIILLMAVYTDRFDNVNIVCEKCEDSLYGILHVQNNLLSVQTSVQYTMDITNALVFILMRGYIHTSITSHSVMITHRGTAKLADLAPCVPLPDRKRERVLHYDYCTQIDYVNIGEARNETYGLECEPLISSRSSEVYLATNSAPKAYKEFSTSEYYRWQAPELFSPDEKSLVHPCSKGDVYSLCLVLWECCNAAVPWKTLTYEKLKDLYLVWNTGVRLPSDGTYPGCLLELLQIGLSVDRASRPDLNQFADSLRNVKHKLDQMEYLVIPSKITKKPSTFSSVTWVHSSTDTESISPRDTAHNVLIHKTDSSSDSDKESKDSPQYESISKDLSYEENHFKFDVAENYSSACSTPISKARAQIKTLETPQSIKSSNDSIERPFAKLTRSFMPQSYKPLHINVPQYNLDSLKVLPKNGKNEKSTYNFNIKDYSLPNMPIARSNVLRRNAWLSGELDEKEDKATEEVIVKYVRSAPETPAVETVSPHTEDVHIFKTSPEEISLGSVDLVRETVKLKKTNVSSCVDSNDRTNSWSFRTSEQSPKSFPVEQEVLARVNVKPLVAKHEKWIYEANKKTGRSMSLPEDKRVDIRAVKPASHCMDALQSSYPQLNPKKAFNTFTKKQNCRNGGFSEKFCAARDSIARSLNFHRSDSHKEAQFDKTTKNNSIHNNCSDTKTEVETDSKIEGLIREIIRQEFQHLFNDTSKTDILTTGVKTVLDAIKDQNEPKKDMKTVSSVKICGNKKPLLQITFSSGNGENSLQVLDNCVNVTFADKKGKENQSLDESVNDDVHGQSLKRCQTFNALQEAKSTEDLYIDDDLSTHIHDSFGRVKLIPLHGSLHELLCDRESDCCLIKVRQENGCDTIYFRCDNSDTESKDAVDGDHEIVYKRSISLVEERIQKPGTPTITRKKISASTYKPKIRPKSEIYPPEAKINSRRTNSSPSLINDEVFEKAVFQEEVFEKELFDKKVLETEVSIDLNNVPGYQDTSSDDNLSDDNFEILEKEIEREVASSTSFSRAESLSVIDEEPQEISDAEDFIKL